MANLSDPDQLDSTEQLFTTSETADTEESQKKKSENCGDISSSDNKANIANRNVRYSKLERTKNQLKSIQELADYFFCYSWMYDKMATYAYYKNVMFTVSASAISILIAQSIFSDLSCSDHVWVKNITGSIAYLSAFIASLIHFLALPAAYKDYKNWAGVCINNYYEIQHWMIDAIHSKETYMQFTKRMTKEFVNLTKNARPITAVTRALVDKFKDTSLQFPPIVGYFKNNSYQAVDLHSVIDQVTIQMEQEKNKKEQYKTYFYNKRNKYDSSNSISNSKHSMMVVDLSSADNNSIRNRNIDQNDQNKNFINQNESFMLRDHNEKSTPLNQRSFSISSQLEPDNINDQSEQSQQNNDQSEQSQQSQQSQQSNDRAKQIINHINNINHSEHINHTLYGSEEDSYSEGRKMKRRKKKKNTITDNDPRIAYELSRLACRLN